MSRFKFELGEEVQLVMSGESGVIIGRAEYSECTIPSYFIRYKSADGRQVEDWWKESAIIAK